MKEIPLTKGFVALVDDEDYELLSQLTWTPNKDGYALSSNNDLAQKLYPFLSFGWPKRVLMHRLIFGLAAVGVEIDHRDRNRLNNQRGNLRTADKSLNQMNSQSRPGTSQYKGVSWRERDQHWRADIVLDSKQTHLGHFACEIDAANAYDRAAVRLFGDFAKLNFEQNRSATYEVWRTPVKSRTGFIGVTEKAGRFMTSHLDGRKRLHLGCFDSAYDAALYRDHYLNKNNLPGRRNFEL